MARWKPPPSRSSMVLWRSRREGGSANGWGGGELEASMASSKEQQQAQCGQQRCEGVEKRTNESGRLASSCLVEAAVYLNRHTS